MSYTIHQVNFNGMDVSTEALIEMLKGYVEDKDLTTITNQITELTTAIETKANTGHKHDQSDVNNLGQALAGKLDVGQHDYSDIISNTNAIPQLDNVNIDNLSIDSKYSIYVDNNEQLIIKKGNTEIGYYNTTTSKWVLSIDVPGQSMTITHRAPITEPIENYIIGNPVFNAGVFGNITPINCIPSVKSTGTYREYLGIIVRINEDSIDFATHGDYLFRVNNSSNYHIGDILTYDGNIIADDTFINSKIMTSIVGKVTAIIEENTVAVFKI